MCRLLINYLSLQSVRQMPNMHKVFNLMKIKHRVPETRLNPYLIYFSRLEQMRVELADEHMDTRGGAGGS